jgi:hypothetical protein
VIEYKKGSENSVVDTISRKIEETLMAMSQSVPRWVALIKRRNKYKPSITRVGVVHSARGGCGSLESQR